MKMRHVNLLCAVACAALVLAGCVDYGVGGKSEYQAPLLSGKDDASQKVDLKGNLRFGKSVQDKFSTTKPLTGFLLNANAGARLTITLTASGGQDPVLILYGPRSDKGIFGTAIAKDDDGKDGRNALIKNFALPSGGIYLVAATDYEGKGGGDFDVSVGCQGNCQEPSCPDMLCDLYCPTGFMTDPNGCPICRCNEPECQTDSDCYNMYPWANGQPVCLDGRCVWNDLYCDENTACPTGYYCEMGPCPGAPCSPDGNCPPCPGKCVPNQMYCNGDFDCPAGHMCLNGMCIPWAIECQDNSQCPPGMECLIACSAGPYCNDPTDPNCKPCDPDIDPWCGQCFGQCVPVQPPMCDESTPCPPGYFCVMDCWSCDPATGQCPPCDPNTDPNCGTTMCKGYCQPMSGECQTDQDCRYPDGQIGYCINGKCVNQQIPCDENGGCPPGMMCVGTCMVCDPAADPNCPSEPICESYCVPVDPPRCYSDFDCVDSTGQMGRCLNGQCVFGQLQCSSDWQCPPNYRCDLLQCMPGCDPSMMPECCYGVCVPDGQQYCLDDSQCVQNGVAGRCINGQCVFGGCACSDVWDPVCAKVCDAAGQCFERTFPNACYARCDNAWVQYAGECGQNRACRSDDQCGPGHYCEFCTGQNGDPAGPCGDVGVCRPLPDMVCQSNQDCPQGYECIFDRCPEMPCTDGWCPPCLGRCVPAQNACVQTGCNGEVCAPFPVNTSCIWLPEYACLAFTTCEQLMSPDGRVTCGFVQTQEYLRCLQDIQNPPECGSDRDCPPGQVCQTFCDAAGVCRTGCYDSQCVCPEYYDPVCGRDGRTYDNICFLSCANMEMAYPGPCR